MEVAPIRHLAQKTVVTVALCFASADAGLEPPALAIFFQSS
jgi:hypothetical protein